MPSTATKPRQHKKTFKILRETRLFINKNEAARRLDVHPTTYAKLENGEITKPEYIPKLAELFGETTDEIARMMGFLP